MRPTTTRITAGVVLILAAHGILSSYRNVHMMMYDHHHRPAEPTKASSSANITNNDDNNHYHHHHNTTTFHNNYTLAKNHPNNGTLSTRIMDRKHTIISRDNKNKTSRPTVMPSTTDNKTSSPSPLLPTVEDEKDESFSACLMLMDDNHRLAEWIPYHYLTLPLRHMVVLVDPQSTTSPNAVLDLWRPYVTIETWTADDLQPLLNTTCRTRFELSPSMASVHHYLCRQKVFYRACAQHLRLQHNRSWTAFTDVDEYVVLNKFYPVPNVTNTSSMVQAGVILRTLKHVQAQMANGLLPANEHYQGPCVTTYRILFGCNESASELVALDVPPVIADPYKFDTLRYRYYHERQIGKSLLDLRHLPDRELHLTAPQVWSAHKVIPSCPHAFFKPEHYIRIHHYLGSWESYSARTTDPRMNNDALGQTKSKQIWTEQGAANRGPDDTLRPWVGAFVRIMGEERARTLLAPVGVLPGQ